MLEFALLAPLAAIVVLDSIPDAFGIESSCVGPLGTVATEGDTYVQGFVVLGTLGWLGVFAGVLAAGIAERRSLALLLPVAWFVVLVLVALAAAAAIGPAPCPR